MRSPAWFARRRIRASVLVVFVLSFHSALGFLSPGPCHTPLLSYTHDIATSTASRSNNACRLALVSPAPLQPRQHCQITSCRLSNSVVKKSSLSAAAVAGRSFLRGHVGAQKWMGPTAGSSSTALSLGSGNQVEGDRDDDGGHKDGWRQRMVRSVVTVFLRIRAVFMALASRLGLGEPGKAENVSNRGLFRAAGGEDAGQAAGGKSRNRLLPFSRFVTPKKILVVLAVVIFLSATTAAKPLIPSVTEVPMSKFMQLLDGKRSTAIEDGIKVARNGKMFFRMDGKPYYTQSLYVTKEVFKALTKSGVAFSAVNPSPAGTRLLASFMPILYVCALYYFVFKKGQGDMVGSTGKLASSSDLDRSLTFGDVAGVDKAKAQVQELVSMIKNPDPFIAAGARLPSGLLMVGPPGTGKTLMARVMASEAGVPFYYCSGSDFVEMFVGRGAARVRKLFSKAAKTAPCIVFFDELDALGKERSTGGGGRQNNDEAEQTLNQLLASMDGLDTNNNGVMVIAATNRFDVLDNALTRPGRFDRVVRVDVPDTAGREAILKVHTRNMKLEDPAFLIAVAEVTPGLAGAELATIANEAAICAARRGSQTVLQGDFMDSVQNFYVSRRKGVVGLQNMFKGMLS